VAEDKWIRCSQTGHDLFMWLFAIEKQVGREEAGQIARMIAGTSASTPEADRGQDALVNDTDAILHHSGSESDPKACSGSGWRNPPRLRPPPMALGPSLDHARSPERSEMIVPRRRKLSLRDQLRDALMRDAQVAGHIDTSESWSAGGHRQSSLGTWTSRMGAGQNPGV
jgi:hypothetical protein